ncbi:MAG: hypothetical protein LBJ02_05850 [Bifidobacteriaceae bacterium]|nr:hypothetical protein [Bifidobacteriaceae bacterium]
MRLLLDTHVIVRMAAAPTKLSRGARERLAAEELPITSAAYSVRRARTLTLSRPIQRVESLGDFMRTHAALLVWSAGLVC